MPGGIRLPVFAAGLGRDSGFVAYGRYWEMNDALYMLFLWGAAGCRAVAGLAAGDDQLMTRAVVLGILVAIFVVLVRDREPTAEVPAASGARVISDPQRGYGAPCLAGNATLRNSDVVVFLDGRGSQRSPRRDGRLCRSHRPGGRPSWSPARGCSAAASPVP